MKMSMIEGFHYIAMTNFVCVFHYQDISQLLNYLHTYVAGGQKKLSRQSVFSLRTEEGSAKQYFQFYGFLSQQQNMMQVGEIIISLLNT